MENLHPQLVIEVVNQAYRERIDNALALANTGIPAARGASPRARLASALVAVAERLAPGANNRHVSAVA